jgi:signal transduction histidine kinase
LILQVAQNFETRNHFLENKNIKLQYSFQLPDQYITIKADFYRIKQILFNLVGNAYKFTPEGTIEINCKPFINNSILFEVKDTGIGIAPEMQSIIFERFRKAENKTQQKQPDGIGLGLTISKGLVELMGGKIWLNSEENKGTTFYFNLPLLPSTNSENPQITSSNSSQNS